MKYSIEKLLADTANLSTPIVYQNFFSPSFLNENHVKAALNCAIKEKAKENFKIWVNQHETHLVQNKILTTEISPDQSIEQWTQTIFQDRFCILFSQVEQFNDDMAKELAFFLQPIYQRRGITLGGASITVFLGNYGFTPSGVHQDQDENCIFHFHLGPGYKELFTWEPEKFIELTGSKDPYFSPLQILPAATSHRLHPGDFLCLPPKNYHIGRTDQFSVDVVVVLSDRSNISFTQDIFSNLTAEGFARQKQIYKLQPVNTESKSHTVAHQIIDHLCINQESRIQSFEDVMKSQIEDRYLTLQSNLNWSYPPLMYSPPTIDLKEKSVEIKNPFKIYYRLNKKNKMSLFLRGRELITNYNALIIQVIDKLNYCGKIAISELSNQFAKNDSDKIILHSFLIEATQHRAINVF